VRGEGLLLGLKCKVTNTDLAAAARAEKLLTVPAGNNVLRLLPPLVIDEAVVSEAFGKLDRACLALEARAAQGATP
jgi:acetylornithine/N-succinyldiaminopimelate aminotransferase